MGGLNESNEKHGHPAETYTLPDASTLAKAGALPIKDEHDTSVPFESLYKDQPGRQLIVFIRHFFCGSCEEYVRALAASLPPSVLSTTNPPTTLTLIGCGQPAPIPEYRKRTMATLSQPYKVYCDPSQKLYKQLDMAVNLDQGGKQPEYINKGFASIVLGSAKNMLMSGTNGLKGGAYNQNGGEWLFEEGELKWCHRMTNTHDHAEVRELKEVLGME